LFKIWSHYKEMEENHNKMDKEEAKIRLEYVKSVEDSADAIILNSVDKELELFERQQQRKQTQRQRGFVFER